VPTGGLTVLDYVADCDSSELLVLDLCFALGGGADLSVASEVGVLVEVSGERFVVDSVVIRPEFLHKYVAVLSGMKLDWDFS